MAPGSFFGFASAAGPSGSGSSGSATSFVTTHPAVTRIAAVAATADAISTFARMAASSASDRLRPCATGSPRMARTTSMHSRNRRWGLRAVARFTAERAARFHAPPCFSMTRRTTIPSMYWSLAASPGRQPDCSGAIHSGSSRATSGMTPPAPRSGRSPKSVTHARPSGSTSTFAALNSPWTTPRECAKSSAAATCSSTPRISACVRGFSSSHASSVRPAT